MKKALILFILVSLKGYSQDHSDKWFSNIDLEFIVPNKVEYDYHYTNQPGIYIDEIVNTKPAFGANYSFNYNLFKKLSIGAITGLQFQGRPDLSIFKAGPAIKYFFVNNDNVYIYLNPYTYNFSLNKNQFKNGANTRLGIGFPISKREDFNINLNIFYDISSLSLRGSKPLYNDEIPQDIIFRSFGTNLGIQF